jgi:hypothetical protein
VGGISLGLTLHFFTTGAMHIIAAHRDMRGDAITGHCVPCLVFVPDQIALYQAAQVLVDGLPMPLGYGLKCPLLFQYDFDGQCQL